MYDLLYIIGHRPTGKVDTDNTNGDNDAHTMITINNSKKQQQ